PSRLTRMSAMPLSLCWIVRLNPSPQPPPRSGEGEKDSVCSPSPCRGGGRGEGLGRKVLWRAAPWALVLSVVVLFPVRADEVVRLSERFPVGYQYQVRTRVQLSGSLAVPGEKGKPAPTPVPITGESAIDYDE